MLNARQRGLYVITDGPKPELLSQVENVLRAGVAVLQYRDKTDEQTRRHNEATALQRLCQLYNVALIINDDVALAHAVGAAGVHLGKDDVDIDAARALLGPDAIIGVSCYTSLERARDFVQRRASYLAFGSFFASPTKPNAARAAPELLTSAREWGLPLVAIGGITPQNGKQLLDAGANYLAAISGVFGAPDPVAATKNYLRLFS